MTPRELAAAMEAVFGSPAAPLDQRVIRDVARTLSRLILLADFLCVPELDHFCGNFRSHPENCVWLTIEDDDCECDDDEEAFTPQSRIDSPDAPAN